MPDEEMQIDDQMRETLRNEYNTAFSNWRSFHILEFAILAFAAGFVVTLVSAYRYVYVDIANLKRFGEAALFSIPLFGIVFTITIDSVVEYVRFSYRTCLIRSAGIEIGLGARGGQALRLLAAPRYITVITNIWYVREISILMFFVWLYLAYLGASLMKGG